MSVRSLFQGKSPLGSAGADSEIAGVISPDDTKRRLEVLGDIEAAGIGWIWASDAEGRLIYLTEGAREKLGKERSDLLGKPIVELFETDRYLEKIFS